MSGRYYKYGAQDQAQAYHKTTKALADYAAQKMTAGKEIWTLIHEGKEATFEDPEDPGNGATPGQVAVYKGLYFEMRKNRQQYVDDKFKTFRLIMGQCTGTMRQKMEAIPEFKEWESKSNVVALLKAMKELVYSSDKGQHPAWVAQAQMKKLVLTQQEPNESLENFTKRFEAQLEVTEQHWGQLTPWKFKSERETKQVTERDQYLACMYLNNTDRGRYKPVIDELGNDFTMGNDNYPSNIAGVVTMLSNRRGDRPNRKIDDMKDGNFTSFGQVPFRTTKKCHYCGKKGHLAFECKKKKAEQEGQSDEKSGWFEEKNQEEKPKANKEKKKGGSKQGFQAQFQQLSAWDSSKPISKEPASFE